MTSTASILARRWRVGMGSIGLKTTFSVRFIVTNAARIHALRVFLPYSPRSAALLSTERSHTLRGE